MHAQINILKNTPNQQIWNDIKVRDTKNGIRKSYRFPQTIDNRQRNMSKYQKVIQRNGSWTKCKNKNEHKGERTYESWPWRFH